MIFPAKETCGALSVQGGVEFFALASLILEITVIAWCNSAEALVVMGISIPTSVQIILSAWAFIGIPIAVAAGCGVVFGIESSLRVFLIHMAGSFIFLVGLPLTFAWTGSICHTFVRKDVEQMGSVFVCTFADTFFFTWLVLCALVHLYAMYIVWSAAEDIANTMPPTMAYYKNALQTFKPPEVDATTQMRPGRALAYGTGAEASAAVMQKARAKAEALAQEVGKAVTMSSLKPVPRESTSPAPMVQAPAPGARCPPGHVSVKPVRSNLNI